MWEIYMTNGLKEALLFIIEEWELELSKPSKERRSVLMYYGISCIGKSTLSLALEYYFGLLYETTWYARLSHDELLNQCSSRKYRK